MQCAFLCLNDGQVRHLTPSNASRCSGLSQYKMTRAMCLQSVVVLPFTATHRNPCCYFSIEVPKNSMLISQDLFEALEADLKEQGRRSPKRPRLMRMAAVDSMKSSVFCSCESNALEKPDVSTRPSTSKHPIQSSAIVDGRIKSKEDLKPLTTTIVRVADHPPSLLNSKNHFSLNLHLSQFEPWEISVKVLSLHRTLVIQGRHEITCDENSQPSEVGDDKAEDGVNYECLEYVKHLKVPANVDLEQIKCTLDQNGWLQIEAPTRPVKQHNNQQTIPVQQINRSLSDNREVIVID